MRDDTATPRTDPAFANALIALVRDGAQRIINQAVQAEFDAFLQAHTDTDDAEPMSGVRNDPNSPGIICLLITNHSKACCPNPS